jgi:general secretion pathway protein G
MRAIALALVILATSACTSDVQTAKDLLRDSIAIETDIEFEEVKNYPGGAVCGSFSAYLSYHEARSENAPFIVLDGNVDKTPSSLDRKIYCSNDPAAALLQHSGLGLFDKNNQALIKITRDFSLISGALESYYQDNHQFPSESQGLQALVAKPKNLRYAHNYRDGGYLAEIPLDPWGQAYTYSHIQWGRVKGSYELLTLGSPATVGGTGEEADVSSDFLPYLVYVAKWLGVD